jgi:hypothetical protein
MRFCQKFSQKLEKPFFGAKKVQQTDLDQSNLPRAPPACESLQMKAAT